MKEIFLTMAEGRLDLEAGDAKTADGRACLRSCGGRLGVAQRGDFI